MQARRDRTAGARRAVTYEYHEAYWTGCKCKHCRYRRTIVDFAYFNMALSNDATTRESMERAFEKVHAKEIDSPPLTLP